MTDQSHIHHQIQHHHTLGKIRDKENTDSLRNYRIRKMAPYLKTSVIQFTEIRKTQKIVVTHQSSHNQVYRRHINNSSGIETVNNIQSQHAHAVTNTSNQKNLNNQNNTSSVANSKSMGIINVQAGNSHNKLATSETYVYPGSIASEKDMNTRAGNISSQNTDSLPQLVECPICGEITMNNFHYGGIACDSCKAFFRRTAVSPSKKSEKCKSGTSKCLLKNERRNNCPFCRFQQCLRNGMNPNLIKTKYTPSKIIRNTFKSESKETISEESHSKSSLEHQLSQILEYHKLVLSQTSAINLMTVPDKFINLIHRNLMLAKDDLTVNRDVFVLAEIEHIFLSVKSEFLHECRDKIDDFLHDVEGPSHILLKIHELSLEWIMRFMKGCKYFEGLSWECKARLLRKNIQDISIFLLIMSYEKKTGTFKFDLNDKTVELDQYILSTYLSSHVAQDLFEFAKNFSQLEIPGHVLIIMVILCLYSRDGMMMKKQEKVDKARNYYQQLLFRYIKETNGEDQSSRLNATLHRALKTVKDFGENIRGLPIMKSQPGGNLAI